MIWFDTAGGLCYPVGLRLLLGTYLGTRLIFLGWCRSALALLPVLFLRRRRRVLRPVQAKPLPATRPR